MLKASDVQLAVMPCNSQQHGRWLPMLHVESVCTAPLQLKDSNSCKQCMALWVLTIVYECCYR
jgi:hypothetical protein